jgi:hypothetical protein
VGRAGGLEREREREREREIKREIPERLNLTLCFTQTSAWL